jgi:hypothetical protein
MQVSIFISMLSDSSLFAQRAGSAAGPGFMNRRYSMLELVDESSLQVKSSYLLNEL